LPKTFAGALPVRFAVLCWPLSESDIGTLCARMKVPNEERELALLACRAQSLLSAAAPAELLGLLKRADAFRRPERFALLIEAAKLAQPGFNPRKIQKALEAAGSVDAGAIAAKARSPAEIPALLDRAREQAIQRKGSE